MSMRMLRLGLHVLAASAAVALASSALAGDAQPLDRPLKIGVLNDRSGPYADAAGEGSAVAARLAADEFGNKILSAPIEIVVGDHTGKPDIGVSITRRWFENENVDVIADIANSGVGLAVVGLAKERNKIVLNNSASSDFTGKACAPSAVQWSYNTYAVSNGLSSALKGQGLDSAFIIMVDYAYGRALAGDFRRSYEAAGGKVVGEVRHPLNTADFSSYLLQAQSSGAKVVVLADSGADLVNIVKQATEFGIAKQQVIAVAAAINISEVEGLGLEVAQGLLTSSAFEWERSDESRAWTKRFIEKMGRFPTADQAATYSSVKHYLTAVAAVGSVDTDAVMAKMRELPVNDAFAANGRLREDGQMTHDLYLVRIKKPSESKEKGDYLTVVQTLAGDEVFQPLSQSACPLVKK